MELERLNAAAFKSPAICLSGVVDYDMYTKFRTQFDAANDRDLIVVELSTLGGDPEGRGYPVRKRNGDAA